MLIITSKRICLMVFDNLGPIQTTRFTRCIATDQWSITSILHVLLERLIALWSSVRPSLYLQSQPPNATPNFLKVVLQISAVM